MVTTARRPNGKLWRRMLWVGALGAEGVLWAYAAVAAIIAGDHGSEFFVLAVYVGTFIAVPAGLIVAAAAIASGALRMRKSVRAQLIATAAGGLGISVLGVVLLCFFGPIGAYFAAFFGGGGTAATAIFVLMVRAYRVVPFDPEVELRRAEARKRDERAQHA